MKKAPASSREQTSAGPSHPSLGRGSLTPRGRGRGHGLGARLAHGIAAFFSMCRDISADVHELARRQRETDDNLHRQSITMGIPFAPRSPDVPLHAPLQKSMNGTNKLMVFHSCLLKMKMLRESSLMIEISLSRLPTRVIQAPRRLILPPDLQEALLPLLTLGRKTLLLIWRLGSLIPLHPGNMWLCLLLFLVLAAKRGREGLLLGSPRG
jgi:hypothetical protein